VKVSSTLLRAALVAACTAGLTVVPNLVTGIGAAANAATAPTTQAPHASTALRAPAPAPTSHPRQRSGYVAPTSSPTLQATNLLSDTFATAATAATPSSARTWGDTTSATSTLVLYDTTDTFGWLGELYAMATGNLASHFGSVTAEPVVDYQAGQVDDYTATIYLGSTYNEPIPLGFLSDVLNTTHPVLWAGDNIWQLSGTGTAETTFQSTYGWDASTSYFDDVDSITQVAYNGQTLTRNAGAGNIIAPHITSTTGQVTVLGSAQCGTTDAPTACAPIAQTPAGSTTFPWAIRSANLTYIGEIPLSFMGETDRYLAFSDQLFSLLAPAAPAVHQALVRLEDVSPGIDSPASLKADADYLSSVHVPFSVGVIPAYTDPSGYYDPPNSSNIGQTSNATIAAFNDALRYMVSKGGTLIEHGYTHQYSNVRNPYSAVTGDDFEFYRSQCSTTQNPPYNFDDSCADADWIIQEGPLPDDSAAFAQSRISTGQQLFTAAGLPAPTIWETPHYSASAVDYSAFNSLFATRYEREQFFGGQLTGIAANASHVFGQFYPYVVHDVYGATVLPEDLGNYAPNEANHNPARPPATIIANAAAELAVRQGVASFFFHPYYDVSYLQQIVEGIQGLGYTFVAPSALLPAPAAPAVSQIAPNSGPSTGGTTVTITGANLAGATGVHFGTTAATMTLNTPTQIVVKSPAHVGGAVDVTVTAPGGTSSIVPADVFTYLVGNRPAVSKISPTSGPSTGGTQVTISGSNLGGATSVRFGTVAATISSNSTKSIVVHSPAGTAGTVDVTVTTAGGTSNLVTGDRFTYTTPPPAPAVAGIAPTSGTTAGGTSVTITGSNLNGASSVHFGTTAASISSISATQIVVRSPAHAAGTVDVTVTTAGGTSGIVAADAFTYAAATTTKVTSSAVGVGFPVTFTATVTASGGTPTGSVRFTDGGTTIPGCDAVALSGGKATCSETFSGRGSHSIVGSYGGDSSFAGSSGTLGIKVR
jgi:uncharacterized protein YdaL